MRKDLSRKEFQEFLYGDKMVIEPNEKEYTDEGKDSKVLIDFKVTPYDILMDKMRLKVKEKKDEKYNTLLYVRFRDTEEAWELGYVEMDLNFWKFVEDVFAEGKPLFYRLKGDSLTRLSKGDYIGTVKLPKNTLDSYIEY